MAARGKYYIFSVDPKYLNLLGGIYILDCLPAKKIHDKILAKAEEIAKSKLPKPDKAD